ncbi:helix-turn-helix domain-containing protein [Tianweitania populi]|uniref:helix-turn-helix domain-containing protein n=1 Tax=Tianweitania populi TaxID=1607949 RepID=UPI001FCE50FB|nr:helix-turn-helix transcriptional regulator [Tianweitania populi]
MRERREADGLTRAEFASLVGLSMPVYGPYERAFSSLTVPRLIHLCELFGIQPLELIFDLAPHLYAETQEEADERRRLIGLIQDLPHSKVHHLVGLLEQVQLQDKAAQTA